MGTSAEDRAKALLSSMQRPIPGPPWARSLCSVGITGTNGKTSTTHFIAHGLSGAGHRSVCKSTLGLFIDGQADRTSDRGPGGFFRTMERHVLSGVTRAAIEVTSRALTTGFAKQWRFDAAVFTNLTRDHIAEHQSWDAYLAAKAQLFVHLGPGSTAILNACDEASLLLDLVVPNDVTRIWYAAATRGKELRHAQLRAHCMSVSANGTDIALANEDLGAELGALKTRLIGAVFGENALAAAAALRAMQVPPVVIREAIESCPPPPGRFEVLHREPYVVLDYAHTPDALERVCDTARELVPQGRLIVVFGAAGGFDAPKRPLMGEAVGSRADIAYVTNENPRREDPEAIVEAVTSGCRAAGRADVRIVYDRRTAIEEALAAAGSGDLVLVTGRGHDRGMYFATGVVPYSDYDVVRDLIAQ
ncbi:MAG: UDP-N-acetylmuramyl-tripeptide synthetase [Polyangiaceae bacterium]|nr:UDP-N-acetylmuramyl-tripeptide synthetase [Polyangiaceae bacterium]